MKKSPPSQKKKYYEVEKKMITIKKNGVEITCTAEEAKSLFPELFGSARVIITEEAAEKHSEAAQGIKKKIAYPDHRKKPTTPEGSEHRHRRFKGWTDEEISYLQEHYKPAYGVTDEIAKALGRTKKAVSLKAQRLGLTKQTTPPIKKEGKPDNTFKRWTRSEIAYLKAHYKKDMSAEQISDVLKRSIGSLYTLVKRLRRNGELDHKKQREKNDDKEERRDGIKQRYEGSRKRMTFINSRASWLCKNYGYDYQKARTMAADEWREGERKIEAKKAQKVPENKDVEFPVLKTLAVGHTKNMIPVLHHIVSNKGCLTIDETEQVCNPAVGFWNSLTWERFMAEIISKSKDISAYYGVRNRFSIKEEQGRKVLCYGE